MLTKFRAADENQLHSTKYSDGKTDTQINRQTNRQADRKGDQWDQRYSERTIKQILTDARTQHGGSEQKTDKIDPGKRVQKKDFTSFATQSDEL